MINEMRKVEDNLTSVTSHDLGVNFRRAEEVNEVAAE